MSGEENDRQRKLHRVSKRGHKALKRKTATAERQNAKEGPSKLSQKQRKAASNPKAFAMASGRRAQKQAQRSQEIKEKKLRKPILDRTPTDAPPPMVVAVMGPPGCGKSSLIRSLVKKYTQRSIPEIRGPVTVVAGKKRRLTFVECGNDLSSMIDTAKVADLVLLMVHAQRGFELETFEFMNLLQVHGMARVLGVLSHLDLIKDSEKLKEAKKRLKHRFWQEVFQGCKLFYLSGILNGKHYLPMETQNLSRFISVTKPKPLLWRNTHGYMLVDRVEAEDKSGQVSLYGWVRGTTLKFGQMVHLPGVGDHEIKEASILDDPCPLPNTAGETVEVMGADGKKRRLRTRLSDKSKQLYAPMCELAGVLYDEDAIYLEQKARKQKPPEELSHLADVGDRPINTRIQQSGISLFKTGEKVTEYGTDEDSEIDGYTSEEEEESEESSFSEDESIDEASEVSESEELENLLERVSGRFKETQEEEMVSESEENSVKEEEDLNEKRAAKKAKFEEELETRGKKAVLESNEENEFDRIKAELAAQQAAIESEFADLPESKQAEILGCRAGKYVRIRLKDLPAEFMKRHDPHRLVFLGGLLASEATLGFCQARFKRHRWFTKKVLKNDEPLIFSVGWRRFQSIPLFSVRDAGTRHRLLKYTPEHLHCLAHFYAPLMPPGTGLLAFRSLSDRQSSFRIAATGTILEYEANVRVMKKLRLVGYPLKIHRNTAFIRDMFTSNLEVAKFEGAQLRTVSGIRGQLKKALKAPEGAFRATFEDKILLSDIVFLRTWYAVKPRALYVPITNLVEEEPPRMRLNVELRAEKQQPIPFKRDSLYRDIEERPEVRRFNPLVIPKSLQRDLPFESKPKQRHPARSKPTYRQQRAIMLEPQERKALGLLSQLSALEKERQRKRKSKREQEQEKHRTKQASDKKIYEERISRLKRETIAKKQRR